MSIAHVDPAVHVRAPGKINLYLGVGGTFDDGYHALATVFQTVSLYEDLSAESADDFTIEVHGDRADAVPADDRNLALRAARLLAATTGYPGGAHLIVHKTVPVAGGMGGGSADAAAALVACNTLWGTELTAPQLHELAARLGADVPALLMGGTTVGTGRGDQLTPALARGRFEWVLIADEAGLSTPLVYQRLDEYRAEHGALADDPPLSLDVPIGMLQALRSGDAAELAAQLHNDLEIIALRERPELERTLVRGMQAGALRGMVSGSGPTIAFLCADAASADRVQAELAASGHTALRAHGPVRGARLL